MEPQQQAQQSRPPRPAPKQRQQRPNYAVIHSRPLPLETYALPAFVPHNPLSILRILAAVVSQFIWPQSSHPVILHRAYFSPITLSVHVTDELSIRALWEQGFFGKGTLSRSEPSWLDREKRRKGMLASETSEEVTRRRREERRNMKIERARKERETIENQLRQEGKLVPSDISRDDVIPEINETPNEDIQSPFQEQPLEQAPEGLPVPKKDPTPSPSPLQTPDLNRVRLVDIEAKMGNLTASDETIVDQEHLQLAPEEAFFLSYGLGVLDVTDKSTNERLSSGALFQLLRRNSYFPASNDPALRPDDPFLLKYVTYHHFRSLGWVVRPGVKFSADYLLYLRGPVFAHAEFAVLILPSYSHSYWTETTERQADTESRQKRDWHWLHCINRVQSHVKKSLVIVYVDIPPPFDAEFLSHEDFDIGNILGRYKIREFVLRRWVPNRMRK